MTPPAPRRYRFTAITVVVAAIVIGAGIDLAISRTQIASSKSSTSTLCTIPDEGELLMRVLNSSNDAPIGSLPVQVEDYYPGCIPPSLRTVTTNSTGMVLFGGIADDYVLTVDYNHQNFTADTYIGPGTLTCVTLAIPSGDIDISHSQGGEANCETSSSTSSGTIAVVLVQQGTTYQVQSSYDCVAGNTALPFNVTAASTLSGAITASQPGVTLYVATAQEAQAVSMGHPASWLYSSGLTNSTNFSIPLDSGSYVLWTEGADLNCGATIVTPLEQMTTVNVTQAIVLMPA